MEVNFCQSVLPLLLFIIISVHVTTLEGDSLSSGSSENAPNGEGDPCTFRGGFYIHNAVVPTAEICKQCKCNNGTTSCIPLDCSAEVDCARDEVIFVQEECCLQCPYKIWIMNTTIMYLEASANFSEGDAQDFMFEIGIDVDASISSRVVRGDNLWKMSAWVSQNRDGSGVEHALDDQVFGEEDASVEYSDNSDSPWQWSELTYTPDLRDGTCDDYKFFCVKFDQGDQPQPMYDLNFTFRAIDDDEARLIDCTPLDECIDTAEAIPVTLIVILLLGVVVILILCVLLLWRKRRRRPARRRAYHDWEMYKKTAEEQVREVDLVLIDKEVPHCNVTINQKLGEGEFGIVHKGLLKVTENGETTDQKVAIKTTKVGAYDDAEEDLLSEMKLIAELGDHPNILHLIACCSATEPFYLITEFMQYGDLLEFLRQSRAAKYENLDPIYNVGELEQITIARDIAKGMDYIQARKFYHGDLAARNVLVGDKLSVKISDFGLADDLYARGYKRREQEQKIPIKWCSIETILNGICSSQGDVWSFGILLYEVFTLGGTPYPGVAPRFLVPQLRRGHRMEQPDGCPDDVYGLMRRCWQNKPEERPVFSIVAEQLAGMLMGRTNITEFENNVRYVDAPKRDKIELAPIDDEDNEVDIEQLEIFLNERTGV